MNISSQQAGFSSASLNLLQTRTAGATYAAKQTAATSNDPSATQRGAPDPSQLRNQPRGRLLDILV